MGATATDGFSFSNISATTAAFQLRGGKYGFCLSATFGGGNIHPEMLAADASTWVAVGVALTAAGLYVLDLPPGQYRLAVTTATAVYASVIRIPD